MARKVWLAVTVFLLCPAVALAADVPPKNWELEAAPAQYDTGTERVAGAKGAQSAFLRARRNVSSPADLVQRFKAADYIGRRIAFAGSLKTSDAKGAYLFVTIRGSSGRVLSDQASGPIAGTRDWQTQVVAADIPKDASLIEIGFGLRGGGTVWADNLAFAPVSRNTHAATTGPGQAYGDWVFTPISAKDFWAGSEAVDGAPGKATFIEATPAFLSFRALAGTMRAWRAAGAWRGKRIRVSTRLKLDAVHAGWAGCSLAVFGNAGQLDVPVTKLNRLSGTTSGWRDCSLTAEIPDDAVLLTFSYYLSGQGKVWSDGFRMEEAGAGVPETHRVNTSTNRSPDER
jgi:hypothetical protein